MGLNTKEAAEFWVGIIGDRIENVADEDRELAESLSVAVISRWQAKAQREGGAQGATVEDRFKTLYAQHKESAQGAIVAIIEMVRAIGNGERKAS
jgi:hypothetical protein